MMRWPDESRPTEPVRAAGGMLTARPAGGHHSGPGGSHHGALLLASKLCPPVRRPGTVVRSGAR